MGLCCLGWLVLPSLLCTTQEPEVADGCHAPLAKLGSWNYARGERGGGKGQIDSAQGLVSGVWSRDQGEGMRGDKGGWFSTFYLIGQHG